MRHYGCQYGILRVEDNQGIMGKPMTGSRRQHFLSALCEGFAAPIGLYSAARYPYFTSAYSVPQSLAQAARHLSTAASKIRDELGRASTPKG